jgi:hypothetical protein
MIFGKWQKLGDAIEVPDGPGVLQARIGQGADGLIAYPSGKSAMIYYDADDEEVAHAVERLRARAGAERGRVWVRFAAAEAGRAPSDSLRRALDDFRARFGQLPGWNVTSP